MNVVVNGLMTNYQKIGDGKKTIVALHGWGDSHDTFSKLSESLANQYTILLPDLPGFGGTQTPEVAWGLIDYANFVASWLKKINAPKPDAIIGHSFGGAVAVAGVANGLFDAEKLLLISSAGIRQVRSFRKKVFWVGAKAGKMSLSLLPEHRAKRIKTFLYSKAGSDLMLKPEMRQTFVKTVSQDVRPEAAKLKLPVLLIYGEEDNETPVKYGELLHSAITGSKLTIIKGDHFIHQNNPEQVGQLISEFLQ